MVPQVYTALGLATHILSVAGQSILATLYAATSIWVPGSVIIPGNQIILPDSSTTTTPGIYLKDETTPIKTYPISVGTEHCYGHTGALLCEIAVKLTGSGGHRNHNAGSWVCGTATCSILASNIYAESIPVASEKVYGGWTTTPGSASGAQLFNNYAVTASGTTIPGSGSYVGFGANPTFVTKDVPPGSTVKVTWTLGNGTEDYSNYKALWVTTYRKFYTP